MTNKVQSSNSQKVYDLEERTAKFGEDVIKFASRIPRDTITVPIISQFVRSGTSIGANYCEADGAESKKDFKHKMGICKKEAKETKHWLRMIAIACSHLTDEARILWKEAQELTLIVSAIIRK